MMITNLGVVILLEKINIKECIKNDYFYSIIILIQINFISINLILFKLHIL